MSTIRPILAAVLVTCGFSSAFADKPKWTPPQAAFDACAKSKTGDTCSFTGRRGHDVKGTCQTPPADSGSGSASSKALVCHPDHSMNHGGGSGAGSGSAH